MLNVYAPNDVLLRERLWVKLISIRDHNPNPWCVGGDFNEIRNLGERKGSSKRDRGGERF